MARDLLREIITYMETELPDYVDDPYVLNPAMCYAAIGDYEKALDAFEIFVDRGYYQYWWAWSEFSMFEPLSGNPRWEADFAKIHERNAQQRENLARIRAEAQL